MKNSIVYNPQLTIAENAKRNNVSTSTMRLWIKKHNINRRGDNKAILHHKIHQLHAQGKTIKEICKATNVTPPTVYKYLNSYKIENTSNKNSALNITTDNIIKSVSNNQTQILKWILQLYCDSPTFECDITYSIGKFYTHIPQPLHKYDKYPQLDGVMPLEALYSVENTYKSVVMDLPFLIHSDTSPLKMVERFNCFSSYDELCSTYRTMLQLAHRILRTKGVFIAKCMDINEHGTQRWVSNEVLNWCDILGFQHIDTFILTATDKITYIRGTQQHCARKYHSYFFVFRKP